MEQCLALERIVLWLVPLEYPQGHLREVFKIGHEARVRADLSALLSLGGDIFYSLTQFLDEICTHFESISSIARFPSQSLRFTARIPCS